MTHRPLVRPACTPAILRFQQRVEGLGHVEHSMNEYHVDDSAETLMVDDVRDDLLIRMKLAYPEMQCERPGESTPATGVVGPSSQVVKRGIGWPWRRRGPWNGFKKADIPQHNAEYAGR